MVSGCLFEGSRCHLFIGSLQWLLMAAFKASCFHLFRIAIAKYSLGNLWCERKKNEKENKGNKKKDGQLRVCEGSDEGVQTDPSQGEAVKGRGEDYRKPFFSFPPSLSLLLVSSAPPSLFFFHPPGPLDSEEDVFSQRRVTWLPAPIHVCNEGLCLNNPIRWSD